MSFTFANKNRIISKWDGTGFQEEVLTLSGVDGINVTVDDDKFVVSGNQAALSGALVSGYEAGDDAVTSGYIAADAVVTSGYEAGDDAVTSGYIAADAVVTSGYEAADVTLQSGIDTKVNRSGDTMTGALILVGDCTTSGQAANKHYVDSKAAAAAINVLDNGVAAATSIGNLDFKHAFVITSGTNKAEVDIVESELTQVVMLTGNQTISGNKVFANDVSVGGDFYVSGTTTTINTETVLIEDNILTLNSTVTGNPDLFTPMGGGVEVERGAEPNSMIYWNETSNKWEIGISGAMDTIVTQSGLDAVASGAQDCCDAVTSGYIAADAVVTSGYEAGDDAVTSGYIAADAVVTSGYEAGDDAVTSGYIAADAVVTSGYEAGDDAVTSGYIAADAVVTSGYQAADVVLSGAIMSGVDAAYVSISGDTMTGALILSGDCTTSGQAANKHYVDSQVASAAVQVQEDAVEVQHSAGILDFGYGLDVTSGTGKATITVDESELLGLVHRTGNELISGTKTFDSPVILASGSEPASVSAAGTVGEIRWSDDYMYICVATNTWKRSALASF